MIKLVDIESVEEENVTFGTCELCFRVMDYTFEYFIFEDDKTGERHSIPNGEWCWGDFFEDIWFGIDENICDIADFLIKKNIQTFEELESKWGDILSEYKQQSCLEEDYEGKIDIQENENKVLFDLNGKRITIYNSPVVVEER